MPPPLPAKILQPLAHNSWRKQPLPAFVSPSFLGLRKLHPRRTHIDLHIFATSQPVSHTNFEHIYLRFGRILAVAFYVSCRFFSNFEFFLFPIDLYVYRECVKYFLVVSCKFPSNWDGLCSNSSRFCSSFAHFDTWSLRRVGFCYLCIWLVQLEHIFKFQLHTNAFKFLPFHILCTVCFATAACNCFPAAQTSAK